MIMSSSLISEESHGQIRFISFQPGITSSRSSVSLLLVPPNSDEALIKEVILAPLSEKINSKISEIGGEKGGTFYTSCFHAGETAPNETVQQLQDEKFPSQEMAAKHWQLKFPMSRYDEVSSSGNGQFGTGALGVPNMKSEGLTWDPPTVRNVTILIATANEGIHSR